MCGIIGYIGKKEAAPILLQGLKTLEYRGYDSAGIAVLQNGTTALHKKPGKVLNLQNSISEKLSGTVGIGHTRWATHGIVNELNAHPHQVGRLSFIHNGIIENFQELRESLMEIGYKFVSDTDTETFGHLVLETLKQTPDLATAIRMAFRRIQGTATIVMIDEKNPEQVIAIKRGTPLVTYFTEEGGFIASDPLALMPYTNKIFRLNDNEMVIINRDSLKVFDVEGKQITPKPELLHAVQGEVTRGEYPHFMLKEMMEQEISLVNTLSPHLVRDPLDLRIEILEELSPSLRQINRIVAIACGTASYACLSFKYLAEKHLRIPVEVDFASEFRYRKPVVDNKTLFLCISQSGETADTIAAIEEAKSKGAICLCICNVRNSSMVKLVHGTIFTNSGHEICVCSTKAFTSQLLVNCMLVYKLGEILARPLPKDYLEKLLHVPSNVSLALQSHDKIKEIAKSLVNKKTFMFLGRGPHYPMALEGALKLKEIAYVHAEGHASGELKHGHIALVDENIVAIGLAPTDGYYEKTFSNLMEVKSRGGTLFCIGFEDNENLKKLGHHFIAIPKVHEDFQSIISVIPLQLFSYEIAKLMGREIDQPRNLAKSVTVE